MKLTSTYVGKFFFPEGTEDGSAIFFSPETHKILTVLSISGVEKIEEMRRELKTSGDKITSETKFGFAKGEKISGDCFSFSFESKEPDAHTVPLVLSKQNITELVSFMKNPSFKYHTFSEFESENQKKEALCINVDKEARSKIEAK